MTMTAPPEITADNVATLFPEVDTSLAREVFPSGANQTARSTGDMEGYDDEQVRLMDEVCIVLDKNDRPIGSASKKACKFFFSIRKTWGSGAVVPSLQQETSKG